MTPGGVMAAVVGVMIMFSFMFMIAMATLVAIRMFFVIFFNMAHNNLHS